MDNTINSAINEYRPEIINKQDYSTREILFAFLAAAMGFVIIKLTAAPLFVYGKLGLGAAVTLLCLIIYSTAFSDKRKKFNAKKALRIALCISFSVNIFITSNIMIQSLDLIFVLMILLYDKLCDNDSRFEKIRSLFPADMLTAAFIMPAAADGSCISAMKCTAEKSNAGKNIKNALLGLAIAIPSTISVCILLMFADSGFEDIMESLLDNSISKICTAVIQLLIGLPAAVYIFGLCRSADKISGSDIINDDICWDKIRMMRFLPSIAGVFSAVPVCILYVIFFFSQLNYYLASFVSELPENMSTYSEYARRGFFELCIVAVINLAIIISINMFSRYNSDETRPKSISVITCILSVFTVMLIITAISKMVMYINAYGLTPLRVYTTWCMLLLGVVFIGIFISMIAKINLSRMIVTVFTVMFAALSFCNIDRLIADYNIGRYINGTLNEANTQIFRELSADALPSAIELYGHLDNTDREELKSIIIGKITENADMRTVTLNEYIAEHSAKSIIEDIS